MDRLRVALEYVKDFSIAIDGGANVGTWSKVMADRFEKVFSFEPAPDTFECLKRNMFHFMNVEARQQALGDRHGLFSIGVDPLRERNTGSRYIKINEEGSVPMLTVDSLNLPSLGFLKLDLEGGEYLALQGARETIEKYRPVIFVECKKGMSARFGNEFNAPLLFLQELGAREVKRMHADHVLVFD